MSSFRPGVAARLAIVAGALCLEKIILNKFVDFDRAQAAHGLGAVVRDVQHWGFRFLMALVAAGALFAYVTGGEKLQQAAEAIRAERIRIRWLAAHVVLALSLIPLTGMLYPSGPAPVPLAVVVPLWIVLGAAAAWFLVLSMTPLRPLRQAAAAFGNLWGYATIAALVSASAMQMSQRLWGPTASVTFDLVRLVLSPIIPLLSANAETRVLSTSRFAVEVSEMCSGLEGVGMILAFSGAWLVYFRREYVFPRALLLVPIGVTAIFALNVLRIALLFLIGDAGFPDVATYGFHSQAGWIAFIAVACGIVLVSRRSAWLRRAAANPADHTDNPVAPYLMPLLAVLLASAVSHALSSDFEYFYPLRLILGLAALLWYRRRLAALDWRWSWRGVSVGGLVFILWIFAAHFLLAPMDMPKKLALMMPALKGTWILSRLAGAVLLAPLAEELAYRGYLMRRLTSADFESVPYAAVSWFALVASSLAFGVMHDIFWLPGTVTGLAFGLLLMRRGRLGEVVAAHATANALIAVCVLVGGRWELW